jgi:hypothetical protein
MADSFDQVFDQMLLKELAPTPETPITSNKYLILTIFILAVITFYYISKWYLAKNSDNYLVKSIAQTNENIISDILSKIENLALDIIQWLRGLMLRFFANLHLSDNAVVRQAI